MQGSNLDENVNIIGKYNSKLSKKLLNLPYLTHSIELVETDLNEPNLAYDGELLHDKLGAEKEAKSIFEQVEISPYSVNLIFGMGLGYLFQEACFNTDGVVILYEPDLEILRVTLELVDFSKELSMKNVYVVSDLQELIEMLNSKLGFNPEINVLYLNSYKKIFSNEIINVIKEVETYKKLQSSNSIFLKEKASEFIVKTLENLPQTLVPILKSIENFCKDKPVLIVSAGPTLDDNIQIIKENRNKFVIFCVGTAFKALMKNNIVPDFVSITEISDCFGQIEGYDLSNINLIVAPYTHEKVQNVKVKNKFVFPSSATIGGNYWAHLTGIDNTEYYSKGTVSYAALASAKILGAKKIVLVGQDLAFVNNSCYSNQSAYGGLKVEYRNDGSINYSVENFDNFYDLNADLNLNSDAETNRIKSGELIGKVKAAILSKTTCFVKGISGNIIPTSSGYAMFIDIFKEFATKNSNLELINTSMQGAQIDGFKNISLAEVVKDLKQISFDDFSYSETYFDKKNILEKLGEDYKLLNDVLIEFEKANNFIKKIENEVRHRKIISPIQSKNYNSLLKIYDYINANFYDVNDFFKSLATGENYDLQHYVKSSSDNLEEKHKKIYELLKVYFKNLEPKLIEVKTVLAKTKENFYESIDTKS